MTQSTYEERRDRRFHEATITALKTIEDSLSSPFQQHYAAAYGILKAYSEELLVNFAEAFSVEQLAEIRTVLDMLRKLVREDTHLDSAYRAKLDGLAQALRESEGEAHE